MKPQTARILSYLKRHGSITPREGLRLSCWRLGSRVFELRELGYKIRTELKQVKTRDGSARIAKYILA
jgi:hypothetical protein